MSVRYFAGHEGQPPQNHHVELVPEDLEYSPNLRDMLASGIGNVALAPTPLPEIEDAQTPITEHFENYYLDTAAESPEAKAVTEKMEYADRNNEVFRLSRNSDTYEVTVESDLTLESWEKITSKEDWALMTGWADSLKSELASKPEDKRSVVFINPTMSGGGVAMMRPPLVHLLKLQGIDAHWYVMESPEVAADDPTNPFLFTKKMHNISQKRLPDSVRITDEGKVLHQNWAAQNAEVLMRQETIMNAAIVDIDDPQPAPLARPLKEVNPDVKLIWRNHIHNFGELMMDPSTPQGEVHDYLEVELGLRDLVDAYVYHPDINDDFVPADNYDKTWLVPAAIETMDDLNMKLTKEQIQEGLASANAEIDAENIKFAEEGRFDDVQEHIDPDRDRLFQIARMDESKGGNKFLAFGALVRQKVMDKRLALGQTNVKPVQIGFVGNGSVDDPSGIPMYEEMLRARREDHPDIKDDIVIKRFKHNPLAINAIMYNENEGVALVGAQLSEAEGCETRITDWHEHDIPTWVNRIGGMPLQVKEGLSGVVFDTTDPEEFEEAAENLANLMVNLNAYKATRETTREAYNSHNGREYVTTANATRWMRIFQGVLTGRPADKEWEIKKLEKEQIPA